MDKDSILFVKVAPPSPGGALFSGAAERTYLVLGCLIGAAGGPLQAASRTLLIHMAPKDRIAQYFGLFALTGKVTSFVGPLLIGAITAVTASQKAGMAVLVVFFVAGLALLARVREDQSHIGSDGIRNRALVFCFDAFSYATRCPLRSKRYSGQAQQLG